MNVNPGGKQPCMRDTIFNGQIQHMVFPNNYHDPSLCGLPKGMRIILQERGLWKQNMVDYCQKSDSIEIDCCMRHILENQDDFKNQKCRLQKVIEAHGHKVIFYPKFHCELNYIEMYWGAAKRYTRQHCNYTWGGLKQIVPKALDSISIKQIRAYARKSYRYMDAYRKGLNAKQTEYAVKKYKRHRTIPQSIFHEIV